MGCENPVRILRVFWGLQGIHIGRCIMHKDSEMERNGQVEMVICQFHGVSGQTFDVLQDESVSEPLFLF